MTIAEPPGPLELAEPLMRAEVFVGKVLIFLAITQARASQSVSGSANFDRPGVATCEVACTPSAGISRDRACYSRSDYFGINLTATLAGLGVGGIAVALADQKTLENVIAGVSLIVDQAVRVGDVLNLGDIQGTVEEVGLRSPVSVR
jgi:hypothetical protein